MRLNNSKNEFNSQFSLDYLHSSISTVDSSTKKAGEEDQSYKKMKYETSSIFDWKI